MDALGHRSSKTVWLGTRNIINMTECDRTNFMRLQAVNVRKSTNPVVRSSGHAFLFVAFVCI